jgi:mevalonate pyrophosphate decarboxylase
MILDNAAGGSALVTALLFDMLPPQKVQDLQVIAADVSEAAVRSATRKVETWANASHVMTIQMNMEVCTLLYRV